VGNELPRAERTAAPHAAHLSTRSKQSRAVQRQRGFLSSIPLELSSSELSEKNQSLQIVADPRQVQPHEPPFLQL
jgi:hypothetical protein